MKSTYGTGCFALLNTGAERVASRNRLLTTIAYQLDGKRTYALEGAIFIAGAAVQWLRDGLKIIAKSSEVDALAARADPAEQVYLVPAFVGLGAPYWDPQARGAIFGLTRNSGGAEIARAALEAVGYQTRDLLEAMRADWPQAAGAATVLRVDGGMTASDACHAIPRRHPGKPGRPSGGDGNHGLGRGLSRRPRRPAFVPTSTVLPRNGGSTGASSRRWMTHDARAQICRLEGRGAAHVNGAVTVAGYR